jgi:hypothetical protein
MALVTGAVRGHGWRGGDEEDLGICGARVGWVTRGDRLGVQRSRGSDLGIEAEENRTVQRVIAFAQPSIQLLVQRNYKRGGEIKQANNRVALKVIIRSSILVIILLIGLFVE